MQCSFVERNWAGNIQYRPSEVLRPASVDELRDMVVSADRVRVLGTRHSFNDIADADALISLEGLGDDVVVGPDASTVELNPAMTYGRLARVLHRHRLALHNLASLPHISVGGAVATATHGSGDRLGNLATAVSALDVLCSNGEIVHLERADADFAGAVVGLGALGCVLRVRLDVEPEYEMTQRVYEGAAWPADTSHFDELTSAGDSVSLFTTWHDRIEQVWVKSRDGRSVELPGARPATHARHPISGVSADHCTAQLGVSGLWSDRWPHFRMDFTPSSGDELQSELLLPRECILEAIEVVRRFAGAMAPHLLVSEIRSVAADTLWMSPAHRRASVALHFTWRPHAAEVVRLIARLEDALSSFAPRPHWAKLFAADRDALRQRYPRFADFNELVGRFDPRRAFGNDWLRRYIVG